jgi:hypothetical protein
MQGHNFVMVVSKKDWAEHSLQVSNMATSD